MSAAAPVELGWFQESVPAEVASHFPSLSVAPVLTDEIALLVLQASGLDAKRSRSVVRALHMAGLVIERNSEWQLRPDVRAWFRDRLDAERSRKLHALLLERSRGSSQGAGAQVPYYLVNGVGEAYHGTAVSPVDGAKMYVLASRAEVSGREWFLGELADEQQRLGVIAPDAIEPAFVRGMLFYREGRQEEAEPLLRRVVMCDDVRVEVEVACHVLGKIEQRRRRDREAERLFRRSLEIGVQRGNLFGQAQVLHSLAQLLAATHPEDAKRWLRQSLAMRGPLGDLFGEAQVLHTLGKLLWSSEPDEAERLLRRSVELGGQLGNQFHVAQVLHSLGQLLWPTNAEEAKRLLHRSVELGGQLGNQFHVAQVLHSLGQLLWPTNAEEAERLLRRSVKLGEQLRRPVHSAQVLNTLGLSLRNQHRWAEARAAYEDVLALRPDARNEAVALEGLSHVAEEGRGQVDVAIQYLEHAIEVQARTRNSAHLSRMRSRLARLRRRLRS